jgi:PAS domain S-box-containing protein
MAENEKEMARLRKEIERNAKRTVELQKERDLFQQYLNVAEVIIVVIHSDQRVVLINQKGCERLGCTEDDVVGKNWFDRFVPGRFRDESKLHFSKLMAGDIENAENVQSLVVTGRGEERTVSWHNAFLRDESGKIYAMIRSGEDVTEKRMLEMQVRRAEKLSMIGQFISSLAHEIGTPLNVIAGRSEYLLRKLPAGNSLSGSLTQIIGQVDRIAQIVNRLMSFSRIKPMEKRPLALAPTMKESLSFFDPQFKQLNIAPVLTVPPDLPEIDADPVQIQQILFNVILNAIQAMPQGGTLTLQARQTIPRARRKDPLKDGYIRIDVADTGSGIASEHLSRIFDPFFTTKESGYGTGLGLAVSYNIARNHGGWMCVRSQVGEGSVFTVYLPRRIEPEAETILGEKTHGKVER